MRLEPTFDQRLGSRLRELGVLVLIFLAIGMWIVWLYQQSADYKLRVLDGLFEHGEVTLAEVDRLFDEPIKSVTKEDVQGSFDAHDEPQYGSFSSNLKLYQIHIYHGKYVLPPLPSPITEYLIFGVDKDGTIRAYLRAWV